MPSIMANRACLIHAVAVWAATASSASSWRRTSDNNSAPGCDHNGDFFSLMQSPGPAIGMSSASPSAQQQLRKATVAPAAFHKPEELLVQQSTEIKSVLLHAASVSSGLAVAIILSIIGLLIAAVMMCDVLHRRGSSKPAASPAPNAPSWPQSARSLTKSPKSPLLRSGSPPPVGTTADPRMSVPAAASQKDLNGQAAQEMLVGASNLDTVFELPQPLVPMLLLPSMETRLAIDYTELASTGPDKTLDVYSMSGKALLGMTIRSKSAQHGGALEICLPNRPQDSKCTVVLPREDDQTFMGAALILDFKGALYGEMCSRDPGVFEVMVPSRTGHSLFVIEGSNRTGRYDVTSRDGKPVAMVVKGTAELRSGALSQPRESLEIRVLPGADAVLVAACVLFLFIFHDE